MQAMQDLIQNLTDSGCDKETIERICSLCQAGYTEDAIKSLRAFRCGLMDELHKSQYRVDCLDYLVRQLQKETAKKSTTR